MKPIVCIGGGPSVTAADLARVGLAVLEGRCNAIAINSSVYGAWWATHLYAADYKWWLANIQAVQRFPGHRLTIADNVPFAWGVEVLQPTGVAGYDPTPLSVRTGAGSGYQALHYAMQRTDRVILLGYDMAGGHWHGGYKQEPACDYAKVMLPHFQSLVAPAIREGVRITTASMTSPLSCFDRVPLAATI